MAKLYKAEMYILDINETYNDIYDICDDMVSNLDLIFAQPFNVKIRQFEWNDGVDLNRANCTLDIYRKYFLKGRQLYE